MKIKRKISIIRFILLFIVMGSVFNSCETTNLDELDSPNELTPDQSDPSFFLTDIQLEINKFFNDVSDGGAQLTRLEQFNNADYVTNIYFRLPTAHSRAYSEILIDLRTMQPLAEAKELNMHTAIGQVLESYLMMTLVDTYGDVPYSEAALGVVNLNPKLDTGESIYEKVELLLDNAISLFDNYVNGDAIPSIDLYYDGDMSKWRIFANTLRFKLYLQKRLLDDGTYTAKINSILSEGVITTADQDFQFNFSTTDQNPNSRHPRFGLNYDTGIGSYQSNYLMNEMLNGKSVIDPRITYYFYRQGSAPGNGDEMPCGVQNAPIHYSTADAFCYVGDGYLGRDHGDGSSIPPDDGIRTNYGLYPIGGRYDDGSAQFTGDRDQGAKGAGISPIMLSSFVKFMEAESALVLGTTGDPKTLLLDAVRASITKVMSLNTDAIPSSATVPDVTMVNNYISAVEAQYDAAPNKLEVIMQEYLIALKGNGIEAYNSYRRTGFPSNLQPTLTPSPGTFMRSFYYPLNMINNNNNISQKIDQKISVFWDTHPDGFVD